MKMDVKKNLLAVAVTAGLVGCGGGGGSSSGPGSFAPSGSGVDGPLANAVVNIYEYNLDTGVVGTTSLDEGSTNEAAAIQDLSITLPAEPPYIVEFTSDEDTVDLDTGVAPVIGTLRTVITADTIANGNPIYATPLTTMTVDLAVKWYKEQLDAGATPSADLFSQFLDKAQETVKDTLGFGLVDGVDIFATPPLITDDVEAEDLDAVIKYRAAAEAAAKVVETLKEGSDDPENTSTEDLLNSLTSDLSDGAIDGQSDEGSVGYGDEDITDAASLRDSIVSAAAEMRTTEEIAEKLEQEKATTAADSTVTVEAPAEVETPEIRLIADADDDGIPDNEDTDSDNDGVDDDVDAFPLDSTEWSDLDEDGTGDNTDTDIDGDGVANENDDFPLDPTKSDATDVDGDGWPVGQDTDDNDAEVPATAFVDTDHDGLADEGGLEPDTDDDNDGVADDDDDLPLDPTESVDTDEDGIGNNADTDDDNDGTLDKNDPKPLDDSISTYDEYDFDRDGIPNDEDNDADNDGVAKADDVNDLDRDSDDDSYVDSRDVFPSDDTEHEDSDEDGIGNNADTDDDNDQTPDVDDAFPLDPSEDTDTDEDGTGNNADTDDDNDGVSDDDDDFPLDPTEDTDTDEDGTGDNADTDDDNDGTEDSTDDFPLDPTEDTDTDEDGTGDNADTDDDNDGTEDSADDFPLDPTEDTDTDEDGTGDNADTDDDNDGTEDSADAFPLNPEEDTDTDEDGVGNNEDSDDDNDGTADDQDDLPLDPTETVDTDEDGIGNNADTDDDGDGVADDEDAYPLDPTASQGIVLEGTVAKGIVANGLITAYDALNETEIGEAVTDENGRFEIDIPVVVDGFAGGPVMIHLSGDNAGATMVCDVAGGCDSNDDGQVDTSFGGLVDLNGKGLEMMAYTPDTPSNGRQTINLTTQTNMAAFLIEKDVITVQSITDANSQVANLFSFSGDLTEIPVVDITDITAFAAASDEVQKNSILSTAYWRAAKSTENSEGTPRGVTGGSIYFAESFDIGGFSGVEVGTIKPSGQLFINDNWDQGYDDRQISLDDVYGQALTLLQLPEYSDSAFNSLRSWAEVNKAWADAYEPFVATQAQPATAGNETDLVKVQGFFSDLRLLLASADAQSIQEGFELFHNEIQMVDGFSSTEAHAIEQDLVKALKAIDEVSDMEYIALTEGAAYPDRSQLASNGVMVHIENTSGSLGRSFRVQEVVGSSEIDIIAVSTLDYINTTDDYLFDMDVTFAGSAESATHLMTITDGILDIHFDSDRDEHEGDDSYRLEITTSDSWGASFDVEWSQIGNELINPVTFTGNVAISLTDRIQEDNGRGWVNSGCDERSCTVNYELSEVLYPGTFVRVLSGRFYDLEGKSFSASFREMLDEDGVKFGSWSSETLLLEDGGNRSETINSDEGIFEETEQNYMEHNFSLRFTGELPGVDSTTEVLLMWLRSGLNAFEAELSLTLLGSTYRFDYDSETELLTLTNSEGVRLVIDENSQGEVIATLNGVVYATLSQTSVGTLIRYSDGTFESF